MRAYNLIQEEACVINKNASIFLHFSETDSILSQNYDWQTIAYKSNSSVDSVWEWIGFVCVGSKVSAAKPREE